MIARAFAKNGISVSAALCFEGKTILKAGEAEIMLFEWVDDITLETNDVTTRHCRQIGELIGQMHNCKLTIENTPLPASRAFDKAYWVELIDRAKASHCTWAETLSDALDELSGFGTAYAGYLGARMEWMEFNMQRSINPDTHPDEQALGTRQVASTLADILSLAARKCEFMGWLYQP